MDPTQVDDALSSLAGANGFADLAAHFDYAGDLARFGKANADRNRAAAYAAAAEGASRGFSDASGVGIAVHVSFSPATSGSGAVPGTMTPRATMTVSAFSFTSGGSSYAVTPGANGLLVGTKDGQAWKTWQLTDPVITGNPANGAGANAGAATALQTLIDANKQKLSQSDILSVPLSVVV